MGEMRAPCGDAVEFKQASALDGPVGRDVWIVPPVLHADVAQMIGEDVHDGFQSLAHAGEHPLAFRVLAEVPFEITSGVICLTVMPPNTSFKWPTFVRRLRLAAPRSAVPSGFRCVSTYQSASSSNVIDPAFSNNHVPSLPYGQRVTTGIGSGVYSIRESKPFIRRDSSASDVCSITSIILFPALMIVETCSHESGTGTGRLQMCRG